MTASGTQTGHALVREPTHTHQPACTHRASLFAVVLMTFDLHSLAEQANPEKKPMLQKEIAAFLQVFIVSLGGIGRLYTNELRLYDKNGEWPTMDTYGFWSIVVGFSSYVVATGIWVLTTINLVNHAGDPWNMPPLSAEFQAAHPNYMRDEFRSRDAGAVYIVTWVQVGYPFMTLLQLGYFFFSKDHEATYPGTLSFMKDVVYGSLDVTSKGGLALYVALRAGWLA